MVFFEDFKTFENMFLVRAVFNDYCPENDFVRDNWCFLITTKRHKKLNVKKISSANKNRFKVQELIF